MSITPAQLGQSVAQQFLSLQQGTITATQMATNWSNLFASCNFDQTTSPSAFTATLAAFTSDIDLFLDEVIGWWNGTATGGPNGDGLYPLTGRELDANGNKVVYQAPSPAKIQADVLGATNSAKTYAQQTAADRTAVSGFLTQVQTASTTATTKAGEAATSAANALTYMNAIKTDKDTVASDKAIVLTAKTDIQNLKLAAETAAGTATTKAGEASTSALSAKDYRDQAQAAAASIDATSINQAIAGKLSLTGGTLTGNLFVQSTSTQSPGIHLRANGQGTDAKFARIYTSGGTFAMDFLDDAYSTAKAFLSVSRSGLNPQAINLYGTTLSFNGTALTTATDLSTALATKQDKLAYTPVQQGTGINQTNNVVKIGWTAAGRLTATVDSTNLGNVVFDEQLATKAALSHQHAIGDVQNLQPTLDGKLGVNPGLAAGYAAFSVNSLGIDSYQGDGQLNVLGGAVHAKTASATGTGHIYTNTGRGASRIGLHDSTVNLYVSNTSSGTAGQAVTWNQVASVTSSVFGLYSQPQFNGINLATVNDVAAATVTRTKGVTTSDPNIGAGGVWMNSNKLWFADGAGAYYLHSSRDFDPATKANKSGDTFTGNVTFPNNLQVGGGIATGLYGDGGNVAIRAYSGTSTIYLQNAGGAANMATFSSSAANIYQPLTVTGNVTTTGSVFVGSAGGLFSSGNHRLVFDAATGNRVSYRSDSAAAAGINLQTNDGVHRGALYYDGNLGLLNQNNGWRFRTASGTASIYTDAGAEYALYSTGNLAPMTTNTTQTINFGVLKEFVSVAGDVWKSASPGNTYASALGIKGAGSTSDSAVISFHRPGQYATHFGLDQFNRFSVGGWSMGDLRRQLWISGQIPTNTWQTTDDGKGRFYFGANGDTVWASSAYHQWRNGSDATVMSLDGAGNLTLSGELISPGWIRVTGSNGLYWNNWGGGWYMTDATWMRSYGDKNIVTGGTVQMGAFTVTSDRRLKTDIVPISNAAEIIDATDTWEFTKGGRRMYGMLAQDAKKVAPILVSPSADIHPEDGDPILALDQIGYVPLLVDVVRDLRRRVANLEAGL